MILPEESRMSRSVMIPIGNDKEIREHCWLKTLPIMQIENIRFRYILKRYALPQRALPMNAIAAFCISRQGNNSDFLHTNPRSHWATASGSAVPGKTFDRVCAPGYKQCHAHKAAGAYSPMGISLPSEDSPESVLPGARALPAPATGRHGRRPKRDNGAWGNGDRLRS